MISLLQASAGLLLAGGAWFDLRRRIIPNRVSLALGLIGFSLRAQDASLLTSVLLALATLTVMAGFWRLGMVGGGDVKLLAGCVLLVAPTHVYVLLLAVALSGGVLAFGYMALAALADRPWRRRPAGRLARMLRIEAWRSRRQVGLPYGCAIAFGTLIAALVP